MKRIYRYLFGFAVPFLLAVPLDAQPQAPITWTGVRQFGLPHSRFYTRLPLVAHGDTLAFAADTTVMSQGQYPQFAYSHDNGETHSGWRRMDAGYHVGAVPHLVVSGPYMVFAWQDHNQQWCLTSQDAGVTWSVPSVFSGGRPCAGIGDGSNILLACGPASEHPPYLMRVIGSTDGGLTWPHLRTVDTCDFWIDDGAIAFTRDATLFLAHDLGYPRPPLYCARGSRDGSTWGRFQLLPAQPYTPYEMRFASVAADTSSAVAVVASVWDVTVWGPMDLWITRTTDGGIDWETPVCLTDTPMVSEIFEPYIFCRGPLYGVAWWEDWNGSPMSGIYCRFSANHGKSWYPKQFVDRHRIMVNCTIGQFVGNELRLYWEAVEDSGQNPSVDYWTSTGVITPDSIPPDIVISLLPFDTIRVGDTVWFDAQASDNDSVAEARALVTDGQSEVTVLLQERSPYWYRGFFVAPHNGDFRFKGEAEDFWENSASFPDSGWLTFRVGELAAVDSQLRESATSLPLVFPNPSNGSLCLILSEDWLITGPVSVSIYNLLGQTVLQRSLSNTRLDLALEGYPASGVCILEVRSSRNLYRQKILILK